MTNFIRKSGQSIAKCAPSCSSASVDSAEEMQELPGISYLAYAATAVSWFALGAAVVFFMNLKPLNNVIDCTVHSVSAETRFYQADSLGRLPDPLPEHPSSIKRTLDMVCEDGMQRAFTMIESPAVWNVLRIEKGDSLYFTIGNLPFSAAYGKLMSLNKQYVGFDETQSAAR